MTAEKKRGRGWYLKEASAEERNRIASLGGAAPKKNRTRKTGTGTFANNPELAREAGRRGGLSVPREKRLLVREPERAKEIARLGGLAAQKKRREEKALAES